MSISLATEHSTAAAAFCFIIRSICLTSFFHFFNTGCLIIGGSFYLLEQLPNIGSRNHDLIEGFICFKYHL